VDPEAAAAKPDLPTENLSPQYSQLCGILAGFAFVGFSIYLARNDLPTQAANVAASLFAAFVTLMLLAVLYALMAADGSTNRVATGLFVYGLPFGLSSVTLFYTLTLMAMEKPQLHATAQIGRVFVLIIGPAIVMARMNGGARSLKDGRRGRFMPRRLGLLLVCLLVAVGLVVVIWPGTVGSLRDHGVVPAYIALGSAVVAGALSPIIAERPAASTLQRVWVDAYLLVSFAALVATTAIAGAVLR
jgi:hypothetical protein